MGTWLSLALSLCILYADSVHLPPCASDEIQGSYDTCSCNLTQYTSQDSPPEPTVQCLSGHMRLNVSKCQLDRSGYNSDDLHLRDPTCVGVQVVDGIAMVIISTNTSSSVCGNSLTVNATHMTYSNALIIPAKVYDNGIVTRLNTSYNVSCSYPLSMPVSLSMTLNPLLRVSDAALPGGVGTVIALMAAYTDPAFSVPYTESTLALNVEDPLYVSVIIPDLDAASFSLAVTRLYATAVNNPNAEQQYDIITNGCPSAGLGELLTIRNNGNYSETRLEMTVFQIAGSEYLYLFADVQICAGQCVPTCNSKGS
ncbi:uromodulin-like isoform X2 [Ambystoma mexicanum]|uniref:uromodulin-like isoform X2 n=1 Tax=Ambystoma mexicanum TaxID=8296 RepID=UPI0037E977CE